MDPARAEDAGDGARAWLAPEAMVARYAGPALLIAGGGGLVAANASGRLLMVAAAERLRDQVIRTLVAHVPWTIRIEAAFDEERRVFDLTMLPLAAECGDSVLILGREATLEHNLARALADSRARYKDLVGCSADFAWETDRQGRFVFISPGGALGYAADDLVGESYRRLTGECAAGGGTPFVCRAPVAEHELWLEGGDGAPACVRISSLPVEDAAAGWRGARGICRDVTVERTQQAALRRAEQREALMRAVVDAIRTEVTPDAMFRAAAGSTANALGADGCWVLRAAGEPVARHGEAPAPAFAVLPAPDRVPVGAVAIPSGRDDAVALAAVCEFQGERLGRLVVARPAARGPWSAEDESFLAGVAAQLGIAMAQASVQEKLRALSTTDELTGLVNRRGLLQSLAARCRAGRRTTGALIYLDLDNFKAANDAHGHARGDEILVTLARQLEEVVRAGDIVARLGGDEFTLWLDGAGEAGGLAKARRLLEAAAESLRPLSADAARLLSLSIGVVIVDDAAGTEGAAAALIERADGAMYAAKRAGKGRIAILGADGVAREVK